MENEEKIEKVNEIFALCHSIDDANADIFDVLKFTEQIYEIYKKEKAKLPYHKLRKMKAQLKKKFYTLTMPTAPALASVPAAAQELRRLGTDNAYPSLASAVALARNYPLDFTLQYPPRREYFQEKFHSPLDAAPKKVYTEKRLLLYTHVPFCEAKCYYCNFAIDTRANIEVHRRYTALLCEQLHRLADFIPETIEIAGIDIGGGTPTRLDEKLLAQLLAALRPWRARSPLAHPLSIETTPSIAANSPERLTALVADGVSRISMGVQSTNTATLAAVNRGRQNNMAEKAFTNLRNANFRRINIDLIFALPGQTLDDWRRDIEFVLAMRPDSITTYDCLYRGKGRALTQHSPDKPTPERYGILYDDAFARLTAAGYKADYGSVNFSQHANESGTSPYYEARLHAHIPYLGVGNYSSSQFGDTWFFAPYGVDEWAARIEAGDILPVGESYRLPMHELMAKQLLLSLNFGTIDATLFAHRFGQTLEDAHGPALAFAVEQNWLVKTATGYSVAHGHFRDMPLIRSLFYTPAAIAWLRDKMTT
jgi:oxygen-independent coproporphyrinogen-3 oxidase